MYVNRPHINMEKSVGRHAPVRVNCNLLTKDFFHKIIVFLPGRMLA